MFGSSPLKGYWLEVKGTPQQQSNNNNNNDKDKDKDKGKDNDKDLKGDLGGEGMASIV